MTLNLPPIQDRRDFKPHDSSFCSGGENWIVVESKRIAVYFTFYPFFFTGKLALLEKWEKRGKTLPNFSEKRRAVQSMQLNDLLCSREFMTEKDNLFSVFSMFIRDKFLYGCFHL